jgi:pseudouridine synthase
MQERLQKIIAAAGIASRRRAEEMLAAGEVTVNGRVVTEPGVKADPDHDDIKVRGRLINPKLEAKESIYILLNKPAGYLSSTQDERGRPLVVDLVGKYRGRVHPVGRLDFNTEGLLLLTNDGNFTHLLTGTKVVPKKYEVKVKGRPGPEQISKLERGVTIDGHRTARAVIRLVKETASNAWYEVVLYEGRNQQIRKMFDSVGHSVVKLRRVAIGPLQNEKLPVGTYRLLTETEVRRFLSKSR